MRECLTATRVKWRKCTFAARKTFNVSLAIYQCQECLYVHFPFNYPFRFIQSCKSYHDTPKHDESKNSVTSTTNTTPTSNTFVVLPYVRGVSEKLFRVLRNKGLKVECKPMNVLRVCFPRPKDKPSAAQSRGVVYKIVCSDCDFVYYGRTYRAALQTRKKEHKRAVRVCDSNSKVAHHANKFNHNMWISTRQLLWIGRRSTKRGSSIRHDIL